MIWAWVVVSFMAGWLACWHLSSFLIKRVLRRPDSLMTDAIKGLPQTSLVRIYKAVGAEIDHRKQEID